MLLVEKQSNKWEWELSCVHWFTSQMSEKQQLDQIKAISYNKAPKWVVGIEEPEPSSGTFQVH